MTQTTTTYFWDCECDDDYINPRDFSECPKCGFERSDQPDSHITEVIKRGWCPACGNMYTYNDGKGNLVCECGAAYTAEAVQ